MNKARTSGNESSTHTPTTSSLNKFLDQLDASHGPSHVLWYELDSNLKEMNLPVISINTRSITGKFAELVINLNLIRERVFFVIITESLLTEESNLVLEIDGYKYHTINRVGLTGGNIKLFHLDYISNEVISDFSVKEDLYICIFL